jgi:molecular chaperone DnaK
MQQDAEAHAEEDKAQKEKIEARNRADQLVYATEKSLKEHGEAVDEETRKAIEDALEELKKTLEGDDADAIKKAEENLAEKSQKLGEVIYQKMQAESEAAGGAEASADSSTETSSSSKAGDDVVDAEVVDEGDKK